MDDHTGFAGLEGLSDLIAAQSKHSEVKRRALVLILLTFLGLVDTLYLGIKRGKPVACSITSGCEEVLNSRYSHCRHPISWFGFCLLPHGVQLRGSLPPSEKSGR